MSDYSNYDAVADDDDDDGDDDDDDANNDADDEDVKERAGWGGGCWGFKSTGGSG